MNPAILAFTLLGLAAPNDLPKDLSDYIQKIREQGATEAAMSQIGGAAAILVGASSVKAFWDEDSESYGQQFMSNACPPPGATREQVATMYAEWERKERPVREALMKMADADRSGFVSTDEAENLYQDLIAGIVAAQAIGRDQKEPAAAAKAMGRKPEEISTVVARYRRIAETFPTYYGETVPRAPKLPLRPGA
jgi:hypothetical protein